MLDENTKVFVIYISFFIFEIIIHLACKAQIALFLSEKAIKLAKYLYFANVFLKKSIKVLSEQIRVNKHAIKLKKGKQLFCGPIYSLKLVEFQIFKTYIKINLVNSFIRALKSLGNCSDFWYVQASIYFPLR